LKSKKHDVRTTEKLERDLDEVLAVAEKKAKKASKRKSKAVKPSLVEEMPEFIDMSKGDKHPETRPPKGRPPVERPITLPGMTKKDAEAAIKAEAARMKEERKERKKAGREAFKRASELLEGAGSTFSGMRLQRGSSLPGRLGEVEATLNFIVENVPAVAGAYVVYQRANNTKTLLNKLAVYMDGLMRGETPILDKWGDDILLLPFIGVSGTAWYEGLKTLGEGVRDAFERIEITWPLTVKPTDEATAKDAYALYERVLEGYNDLVRRHAAFEAATPSEPPMYTFDEWIIRIEGATWYRPGMETPPEWTSKYRTWREHQEALIERWHYWTDWVDPGAPEPPPAKLLKVICTKEEAFLLALLAYMILRNPDNIPKLISAVGDVINGLGRVVQGVGEIAPL